MESKFDEAKYIHLPHAYENRYTEPKHYFVLVADKIDAKMDGGGFSLLDVGGEAGEFCLYLSRRFENTELACLDIDPILVEKGKKSVQGCRFVQGDANDLSMFDSSSFDFVALFGTLFIFDDFTIALNEAIRVAGKAVYIVAQFNEYPVDILRRYRHASEKGGWRKGTNLFSKKSMSDFLGSHEKVETHDFDKFVLPFDLPKTDEPLRSWTEIDGHGNRIIMNGMGRELNLQILTIDLH